MRMPEPLTVSYMCQQAPHTPVYPKKTETYSFNVIWRTGLRSHFFSNELRKKRKELKRIRRYWGTLTIFIYRLRFCNGAGNWNSYRFFSVYDISQCCNQVMIQEFNLKDPFLFIFRFSTFWIFTFLLCHQSRFHVSLVRWDRGQPLNDSFCDSCKRLFKTVSIVDLFRQSTFLKPAIHLLWFVREYW